MRENSEFDKRVILNSFAKRIPIIREKLHMSQTELGKNTCDFLALLMVIMVSEEAMYKELTADKELDGAIEELKRGE